ncbi:unnamed protein product [Gongylonema pulchrum]|uniref:DUF3730 domain-containing protein n=1 Tax=Gongylonema pulchrum TaxID=637853 RepID=A0A183D887_9BILA|nr:unnamed protein product [Gongylonema pulchrum]
MPVLQALNVPGEKDRYIHSMHYALELVCSKNTNKEGRINCLKMCAHIALALSPDEMCGPLNLLIDFCVEMSDFCLVIARCFACILTGIILNLNKLIVSRSREHTANGSNRAPLTEKQQDVLFGILTTRRLDVVSAIFPL